MIRNSKHWLRNIKEGERFKYRKLISITHYLGKLSVRKPMNEKNKAIKIERNGVFRLTQNAKRKLSHPQGINKNKRSFHPQKKDNCLLSVA